MRLARAVLAGVVLVLLCAACAPRPAPGPAYSYADTYAAVDQYFGGYGPHIVDCANRILDRESGHWPYADNGTHHGAWQLHDGFWGSILAAADERNEPASWYNPYQNTWAAASAFRYYGGSFRQNWSSTPGDCP